MSDEKADPPCHVCGGRRWVEVQNYNEKKVYTCYLCDPPSREWGPWVRPARASGTSNGPTS